MYTTNRIRGGMTYSDIRVYLMCSMLYRLGVHHEEK